jgi:hypothetical protein
VRGISLFIAVLALAFHGQLLPRGREPPEPGTLHQYGMTLPLLRGTCRSRRPASNRFHVPRISSIGFQSSRSTEANPFTLQAKSLWDI